MPSNTQKIGDVLFRINEIRKKVSTGKKKFKAVTDPIETYFSTQGTMAKSADKNLQKILEFSLLANDFSDHFIYNKSKLDNPSWLIEKLTEASVGADEKNKEAITIIENLLVQFNAVIDLTEAADSLANAVAALLLLTINPASLIISVPVVANEIVFNEIKKQNKATRSHIEQVKNILTQAVINETIDLLENM